MAWIDWSPDYATHHPVIDRDHRRLLGLINDLHAALAAQADPETMNGLLAAFQDQARAHFRREEALMVEIRYRRGTEHRTQHRILGMLLDRVVDECRSGRAPVSAVTIKFLTDWLLEHVRRDDKHLAQALFAADRGDRPAVGVAGLTAPTELV